MRAVITGATGFIGKALVKELLSKEYEIIVIVREGANIPDIWKNNSRIKIIYNNLSNLDELYLEAYAGKKADIFYHLGWFGTAGVERGNTEEQLRNVKNTCDAVQLAHYWGCTAFINAGSIMEYEISKIMATENYNVGLSSIYSIAKLSANYMGRAVANQLGIKYINVIISNIYGIGEKSGRFLNTTIRKMMNGERILLTHGNQLYDFIYITDAVKILRVVGENGSNNESYYLGHSKQKPLKRYIEEMKDILASDSELLFGAVALNTPSLTYKEFDTAKVEKEFGMQPEITFSEGIIKVKDWIAGGENE